MTVSGGAPMGKGEKMEVGDMAEGDVFVWQASGATEDDDGTGMQVLSVRRVHARRGIVEALVLASNVDEEPAGETVELDGDWICLRLAAPEPRPARAASSVALAAKGVGKRLAPAL